MAINATEAIDVARAIHRISYVEMIEMCEAIIGTIKAREEDGAVVDVCNRDQLADILRWWAECRIDAVESEQ